MAAFIEIIGLYIFKQKLEVRQIKMNRKVSNYCLLLTFLHVISLAEISQNVQHYKSEQIYQ